MDVGDIVIGANVVGCCDTGGSLTVTIVGVCVDGAIVVGDLEVGAAVVGELVVGLTDVGASVGMAVGDSVS